MKIKSIILGLAGGGLLLASCNDEISLVGPSIQPESDRITVWTDTFEVEASTIKLDSVYARTASGLLGQLYDPLYGNLKSDYICQFYCPDNYTFTHEPLNGQVDSMALFIMYNNGGYYGDSLAPMQAKVYEVTEPLDRNYYTNLDPADYCNLQNLIGEKTYTAYDQSISDSIRNITDTNDSLYYTPNVRIRINREIAQQLYDETVNNPTTFASQESFNNFFPGFYITTEFGTGSIIAVAQTSFYIYYRYTEQIGTDAEPRDTIMQAREQFNVTKEVIQMNQMQNENLEQLLAPSDEFMYIKSPSGVCTRFVIPARELKERINDDRILNNLKFSLQAKPQEDWLYAFEAPDDLLLLPEDSVKNFFEGRNINDGITSFNAQYSSSTRTYDFGNISNVLRTHWANNPEEDLVLLAIPVDVGRSTSSSYGQESTTITSVSNLLAPAGVKLKKDKESMTFVLVTSQYNDM